jgi:hypothetical protein
MIRSRDNMPPQKAVRRLSLSDEPPVALAARVASRFDLPAPIEAHDFAEKGNINHHTFVVEAFGAGRRQEYILQQVNQQVFTRPRSVMQAMLACIEAQRRNVAEGALRPDERWETVSLVPTRDGRPFLEVEDRRGYGCWRLMVRIANARTFKSLGEIADPARRLWIAEQAGSGLALYGTLTRGIDVAGLSNPLPGYRDTRLYYDQLRSVLAGSRTPAEAEPYLPKDAEVRQATERHFLVHLPEDERHRRAAAPEVQPLLRLLQENEAFALQLLTGMESGRIRRSAIHGDTKLDNFLFDAATGQVKALVDLDTILPHTWLADWGDMVRSLSNVAGEKESRRERIQVDMEIYRAVARGFLRSARNVTPAELDLMVEAVQVIALELGLRFLTDYLRGDSYFKLGAADAPDLNKTRALAQLTLFERLRERTDETRAALASLRSELGVDGETACAN